MTTSEYLASQCEALWTANHWSSDSGVGPVFLSPLFFFLKPFLSCLCLLTSMSSLHTLFFWASHFFVFLLFHLSGWLKAFSEVLTFSCSSLRYCCSVMFMHWLHQKQTFCSQGLGPTSEFWIKLTNGEMLQVQTHIKINLLSHWGHLMDLIRLLKPQPLGKWE